MGIERDSVTDFVAMGLSAAFNTVDHDVLINVLKTKFGINNSALDWFSSYLRPRWFKVKIGDKCSSNKKLTWCKGVHCILQHIIRCSPISTLPKWVC